MIAKASLPERLREQSPMYFKALPDTIRVPAFAESRPDDVDHPLAEATLDELAFAILGVEAESRAVMRRLSALRDLYDLARRRGGVGAMTLTEVFGDGEVTS
jgi:hypothetical protein